MAEILKGAPVAAALTEKLIARAEILKSKNINPTLAIVRVGEKPGDISYETGATKRCEKIGIDVKKFILPDDASHEKILNVIREINNDSSIHGCLVLRPLPDKKIEEAACEILSPSKDVDCMTAGSLASVFAGRGDGYAPCTAQACLEILDFYGVELEGKNIAVLGRSLVIGRPLSIMLQNRNATITMCHSKTRDLEKISRNSEIIIAAIGRAKFVDKNFIAPGQIIIDVGINVDEAGKLCGDVKFEEVEPIVKAVTPVPAGVGSVTTAVLAKHVIEAAER
ncbi:MAG: bifunctional 5,10-methylene-tetrahydrofolate dehydrogenase/5,10-methylene-tetrahydrofolate cyclohydrolase [Synergistaceae bacterium]|nr:bifunctional 5,10-methylene-tetrahydrofolate dehydrogenase/5,10-methylene-tetrahydrofolate cyclohydrolase [Synergistaceae bacterium]